MKTAIGSLVLLSALSFSAPSARADVIPPQVESCKGKNVGDACTLGGAGTCQNQTCSRLDYAHWDHDASTTPPSTSYGCVECMTGTATSTSTFTNSDTATDTISSTATNTGTLTGTRTNADGGTPPSNDGSSCSVGGQTAAKRIAPWLLASAFSLLFLFGRRRRR